MHQPIVRGRFWECEDLTGNEIVFMPQKYIENCGTAQFLICQFLSHIASQWVLACFALVVQRHACCAFAHVWLLFMVVCFGSSWTFKGSGWLPHSHAGPVGPLCLQLPISWQAEGAVQWLAALGLECFLHGTRPCILSCTSDQWVAGGWTYSVCVRHVARHSVTMWVDGIGTQWWQYLNAQHVADAAQVSKWDPWPCGPVVPC